MYGPKRAKPRPAAAARPRAPRRSARRASRAERGPDRSDQRDERCRRASATTTVRVAKTVPTCGRSIPNETKSAFSSFASAEAEEEPDDRRDHADHERLEHDRPVDLPSRRAERAQRRELAHALRDRDAERVRDHEDADEERDEAEREQEVLEESSGSRSCPWPACFASCCAGAHLRGRRQQRLDLRDELLGRDVRLATRSRSSRASRPCGRCRCAVGRSKIASVAPPSELRPPKLARVPTMRNCSTGPRVSTPIVSPTSKCFVVRGLRVDRDLVGAARASGPSVRTSGLKRWSPFGLTLKREARRAAVREHLVVAADELRLVGDAALGDARRRAAPRTCASSDSGSDGGVTPLFALPPIALLPVMTASVFL